MRDVLQIPGYVQLDAAQHIVRITLQKTHPLATQVQQALVDRLLGNEM